jgi:uncharacterized membrane protein YgcG
MNAQPPPFQTRALVSVLTGFAFLLLATSGVVLFLAPPGRVANWTDWSILGLRKSEWGALHIWFSAVFVIGVAIHTWYNLRPLLGYFKSRARQRASFRREWIVASVICAVIAVGTLAKAPPFAQLLTWNEEIKESWDQSGQRAPIPHAELLTMAALADKAGVELPAATSRLAARGITGFTADTVVKEFAEKAKISAQQIYQIMGRSGGGGGGGGGVSGNERAGGGQGGGVGSKTLGQLCKDEGIDLTAALDRLRAKGIKANEGAMMREIARAAGDRKPYELLEIIRQK